MDWRRVRRPHPYLWRWTHRLNAMYDVGKGSTSLSHFLTFSLSLSLGPVPSLFMYIENYGIVLMQSRPLVLRPLLLQPSNQAKSVDFQEQCPHGMAT